jgi:BlaI family transcriptional regulator, penicillinase repressor
MATNRKPTISQAEWGVMETLWNSSPLTSLDVAEQVQKKSRKRIAVQTVKTLLARLVKKGAITHRQQGNRYLYTPKVAREDYLAAESESFLQRLFRGAAAPMLAHLVNRNDLTAEEIADLRKLLDDKEASQ